LRTAPLPERPCRRMRVFELALAFTPVVSGLALGHPLAGLKRPVAQCSAVKISTVHALWMWSALATTVGHWAGDWEMRAYAWAGADALR
jgi:hypothetical protein